MTSYEEKSWKPLVPAERIDVQILRELRGITALLEQISEKLDKPMIKITQPSINPNPYEPLRVWCGSEA